MPTFSKLNISLVLRIIGALIFLEGIFILLCIPVSLIYNDNSFNALLYSGLISVSIGGLIWVLFNKKKDTYFGKKEGYLIVSVAWIIFSIFGSLPFIFSGEIPSFTDAFFETMSGFSTTGATVLTDIESVSKGILFWRSLTHWLGGMGIIVLSIAILPILGIGGMQLFIAEVPGPTPDKLHPRIKETAKRLWGIYVILTVLEVVFLLFGGMNLFDSVCHSFGTMATGGFGTMNDSINGYSPYIQYVIIVFMVLAGTNFTLHYYFLKRQFNKVFSNEEFISYISLLAGVGIVLSIGLYFINSLEFEQAFRDSLFAVVSITTTTGYVTADYLVWSNWMWFIIFLLMFIGGCAGSTGGGLKVIRQLLLLKNSFLELKRLVHPQAIIPVRLNNKTVDRNVIFNLLAFFLIYMIIFGFGTLIMMIIGTSSNGEFTYTEFETAIGSVAATLGNIGPGIGDVGPAFNYSNIPSSGKWFLSFLMLLGRLELFTVLILFSPSFWKK